MSAGHALVGSWTLRRWQAIAADGITTEPFDSSVRGRILYAADGHMGGFMMHPDWPAGGEGLPSPAFIAYSGRWLVASDRVAHHIDIAAIQGWVGTVLERRFRIDGDRLKLVADPDRSSGTGHRLDFERGSRAGDPMLP